MSDHWLERDAVLTTMKRIIQAREHDCAVMDGMLKGRDAEIESLRSRLAEADKANQLLRADIAAQSREEDLILTALRLDPERYRTECGYLNVPKIIAAIKHPNEYPRLTDSASVEGEKC